MMSQAEQNIMKPLTEEIILDNTNIANSLMTFSEFYLAYLASSSGSCDVILERRVVNFSPFRCLRDQKYNHVGLNFAINSSSAFMSTGLFNMPFRSSKSSSVTDEAVNITIFLDSSMFSFLR